MMRTNDALVPCVIDAMVARGVLPEEYREVAIIELSRELKRRVYALLSRHAELAVSASVLKRRGKLRQVGVRFPNIASIRRKFGQRS